MYLLDTNVVSELRRPRPHRAVIAWLASAPAEAFFLSAVTIGELQVGVQNLRERDIEKAQEIEHWIDGLTADFNVLPMDAHAFRRWAELIHRQPPEMIADAMIAATALVHNLTVVSRNVRDFERLQVPVINPFAPTP